LHGSLSFWTTKLHDLCVELKDLNTIVGLTECISTTTNPRYLCTVLTKEFHPIEIDDDWYKIPLVRVFLEKYQKRDTILLCFNKMPKDVRDTGVETSSLALCESMNEITMFFKETLNWHVHDDGQYSNKIYLFITKQSFDFVTQDALYYMRSTFSIVRNIHNAFFTPALVQEFMKRRDSKVWLLNAIHNVVGWSTGPRYIFRNSEHLDKWSDFVQEHIGTFVHFSCKLFDVGVEKAFMMPFENSLHSLINTKQQIQTNRKRVRPEDVHLVGKKKLYKLDATRRKNDYNAEDNRI
jgi:hypothetical protein